jgi:hypothetical protein
MITIKMFPKTGVFAENKDLAREIRISNITPALQNNEEVTLDFENVESVTQSFIHALISELIRSMTGEILEKIYFKDCNQNIQDIINIVVDYMQEATRD